MMRYEIYYIPEYREGLPIFLGSINGKVNIKVEKGGYFIVFYKRLHTRGKINYVHRSLWLFKDCINLVRVE